MIYRRQEFKETRNAREGWKRIVRGRGRNRTVLVNKGTEQGWKMAVKKQRNEVSQLPGLTGGCATHFGFDS